MPIFLKTIKLLLINLAILVLMLLSVDFILGHFLSNNVVPSSTRCANKLTIYSNCKNVTSVRYMDGRDRFLPVADYINSNGYSFDPKSGFEGKISSSSVFLIGDSFIQADEIPIQNRIGGFLRNHGVQAMEIGYSSWNPYQYERLVRYLDFPEKSLFFIFLMTNDFTPNYYATYSKTKKKWKNKYQEKPSAQSFIEKLKQRSFLYKSLERAIQNLFNKNIQPEKKVHRSHNKQNYNDCEIINDFGDKSSLIYDYVVFSKQKDCWPDAHLDEVKRALKSINNIVEIVKEKNGEVIFFLIPAGWSFENENTVGRMANRYGVPNNIVVKHTGLANYLSDNIKTEFYDLTPFLEDFKNKLHSQKNDYLYLTVDGHWSERTHRFLGGLILNNFVNDKYIQDRKTN